MKLNILELFEVAPKSESTLMRHKFAWLGYDFRNDLGHPCEYRVVHENKTIGVIKYYRGRLLSCYGYLAYRDYVKNARMKHLENKSA